jgi:hypothetical protein
MRTTIDPPEDLLRQAKSRAALDGVKLKDLVAALVRDGLQRHALGAGEAKVRERHRKAPPVIISRRGRPIPAGSAAELRQIEETEDEAKHARSA